MLLDKILVSTPINKTAANVVSQKDVADDKSLSREEIIQCIDVLIKKRKEQAEVLGIKSRGQKKNHMYRYNCKTRKAAGHRQPDLFAEYVLVGIEIQRLTNILTEMKKAKANDS